MAHTLLVKVLNCLKYLMEQILRELFVIGTTTGKFFEDFRAFDEFKYLVNHVPQLIVE